MADDTSPAQKILAHLAADGRYGLAFSGGCDSTYLLATLVDAGIDVKAYLVATAFQADWEIGDAREAIRVIGAQYEELHADILTQEAICANPPDRCYLCKRFIFGTILERMAADNRTILLDGTNATDDPANRPGFRALTELKVRSPLREAGLGKEAIREASRDMGLFTADKPNFSCYATRIPANTHITARALTAAASSDSGAWR